MPTTTKVPIIYPQDGIQAGDEKGFGLVPSQGVAGLRTARDPLSGSNNNLTNFPNLSRLGYLVVGRLNSDGTVTPQRLITTDHPDGPNPWAT